MSKTRNHDALIRIEDAIKVLCRKACHPGAFCPDGYCVEMWDAFKDVERVDAAPVVHGRWECSDKYENAVCSICGYDTGEAYGFGYGNGCYNFCPMCGADMRRKYGRKE